MKLIVGLGNPGEKYKNNRHNVGFMFTDFIASLLHRSIANNETLKQCNNDFFKYDKYSSSEIAKCQTETEELVLAKPQTYMNLSGSTVQKLINNFKLKIENLIVVHDDLDISLGKFKIQKGVGPKLHNGLTSIEESLKTKDFLRIRIGVENRNKENYLPGEAYVLHDFTNGEKDTVNNVFSEIYTKIITNNQAPRNKQ